MLDLLQRPKVKNPRVQAILDEAAKSGKPVWIAICASNLEVTKRVAAYMLRRDDGKYVNENRLLWVFEGPRSHIDRCSLASTKTSPVLFLGSLVRSAIVYANDWIVTPSGGLDLTPDLFQMANEGPE